MLTGLAVPRGHHEGFCRHYKPTVDKEGKQKIGLVAGFAEGKKGLHRNPRVHKIWRPAVTIKCERAARPCEGTSAL